ncbi:sodium-dependent glucose transporter 1-like protein [Leptotrombidium deliense]|uniref:Sodium-dependent glucose transporter 1-like protein n=1 Tax=Leptotrombidium deliense TaxID=299467 RepID=A0A443SNQ1_9ACAR|nr:sodium-dependent glucose transporter 1-like protein [Leptotrombidium deliense]
MCTERVWRWWAVGSLYLAFLSSGIVFNIIPPTLHDLQTVFNSTIGDISPVYTSRSAGYLFGTILGETCDVHVLIANNVLCSKEDSRQLCLVVFVGLMAVTVSVLPFCGSLRNLFIVAAVNGITSGVSDVASNVWLLDMFKEKSGPYIQALYFFFALGSSLSPLLSAPFLKENNLQETKIYSAYIVSGIIGAFSSIILLIVYFASPVRETIFNVRTEFAQMLCNWKPVRMMSWYISVVVGLGFITILVYSGFEISYMQFMPILVTQSKLNVSDTDAAFMNSAMNVAFTCFRGISIIANMIIESKILIYFDLFVLSIATTILFIFINTSQTMLYVGNILMGVGFSSIYPSIYAFVEQYIDVTNFIGSLFAFASGVTAIIYPPVIGEYIERNPLVVLYLNVMSISLTLFAFVALHIFTATRADSRNNNVDDIVLN